MSDKRRIVTNTAANGIALAASILSGLIFMPLLVRGFGDHDYGLYMLALSVAGYASILDLGVGSAVIKKIAERMSVDDEEGVQRLASTALAFYVIVGVLVALLAAVVALYSGSIFKVGPDGARLMRNLMLVVAGSSLVTWPLSTSQHVLMGFQRYTATSRTSMLVSLGKVVATLVVVSLGQGPLVMLVAQQLVTIAGGLLNTWTAWRTLGASRRVTPLAAERAVLRELFQFSWAVFVIQICVLVLYERTDRLILGVFVGAVAITYYEAASKFQQLIASIHSMSSVAVLPTASQLDAEGRPSAIATLFLRGTKYTTALLAPLVVALMVLARPILATWLDAVPHGGAPFTSMALAAQVLISHQLLTVNTAVGDSMLIGIGRLPKRVPYAVAVTVANLVLSLLLVTYLPDIVAALGWKNPVLLGVVMNTERLRIMGVVLGTTLPYFADYPFHIRLLLKELGVAPGRFLREVVLPVYPLLLLPLGIAGVSLGTPLAGSLAGVLLTAAVALGAYWAALMAFGLSAVEREELADLWKRLRRKLGRA